MAESSTSAPVSSRHVFLSELSAQDIGAKVRFLCCILNIDEKNGCVEVEHRYPHRATNQPTVIVNYDLVRQTVKIDVLQIGSWINIIGYVSNRSTVQKRRDRSRTSISHVTMHVQAMLMWSAGAIRLAEYEETLEQQKSSRLEQDKSGRTVSDR